MFENKKKFALWMYPATYEKLEAIYREDNCESRSEFVEKAVNFYIGYLTSKDKTEPAKRCNLNAQKHRGRKR